MIKALISASVIFTIAFLAVALFLLTGCACARVSVNQDGWTFTGLTMFRPISVSRVQVGTNTPLIVEGYKGTVDGEAMGDVIGEAGKVMIGL